MPKSEGLAMHVSRPVQQPLHVDADNDVLREGSTLTIVSRELQRLSGIVSEVAAIDRQRSVEVSNLRQEASNLATEIVRLRETAKVLKESIPEEDGSPKQDSNLLLVDHRRSAGCTFNHTVDVQNDVPKPLKDNAEDAIESSMPSIAMRPGSIASWANVPMRSTSQIGGGEKRPASRLSDGSGSARVTGRGSLLPVPDVRSNQSGVSYFSYSSERQQIGHKMSVEFGDTEIQTPAEQRWSGNTYASEDNAGIDSMCSIPEFEKVQVGAIWQEKTRTTGKKKPPRSDSNVSWKFRRQHQEKKRYELFFSCMLHIMLHPGSRKRLTWDIMGFILLCYDMVVIPFQMGFDPEDNDFFVIFQWATIAYWTLDVPISFISGYQAGELIEMRLKQIAIHYMRTWLFFDIIVLSFDWTLTLTQADDSSDTAGLLRLGRRLRFLRILRLLRLVKIQMMLRDFFEHVQSESTLIFSRIGQQIMSIVLAVHLIACGWYKLGTVDGKTWVTSNTMAQSQIGYKYWTSMHWSVTQFTPASMEVVPVNMGERIYTVCVVLLAMVAFSSLVSGITNGMTQLRNLNKQRLHEYAVLRRYLAENRISTDLMSNIWGFLDHVRRRRTERTREHEVAVLAILPKSLHTELQHEVYWPIVGVHPFFFHFGEVHQWAIRKMYQCALQELSLVVGQEVFTAGEVADRMFFCISGQMTYTGPAWVMWDQVDEKVEARVSRRLSAVQDSISATDSEARSPLVQCGDWVSEPAMWLETWRHCGKLTARISSELLGLYCRPFQELVQRELVDVWQPAQYAKDFADHINQGRIFLHDFWVDFDAILALSIDAFNSGEDNASSKQMSMKVRKQFSQVSRMPSQRHRSSLGSAALRTSMSFGLESLAGRLKKSKGSGSFGLSSKMSKALSFKLEKTSQTSKQHGTLYD